MRRKPGLAVALSYRNVATDTFIRCSDPQLQVGLVLLTVYSYGQGLFTESGIKQALNKYQWNS